MRFWSAGDLFRHAVTLSAPRCGHDLFWLLRLLSLGKDAAERGGLRVMISPQGDKKKLSPARDKGHKKTRLRGL